MIDRETMKKVEAELMASRRQHLEDKLKAAIAALLASIISLLIYSYGMMLAWNYCMPLFGAPTLDYLQSLSLLLVINFTGLAFRPSVQKIKIDD